MAEVPITAVKVTPEQAERSENRRDWALAALFGGGVVMTIFVAIALYLVQGYEKYVFYLAMASQLQILMVLMALAGLLVKRSLKISKGEISIVDHAVINPKPHDEDLVLRGDVEEEVAEAVKDTPAITPKEKK